jgi:hypothetical protein
VLVNKVLDLVAHDGASRPSKNISDEEQAQRRGSAFV